MSPISHVPAGYAYMWEYSVALKREPEFLRMYGPAGEWSRFFGASPDFLGTTLLRHLERPGSYITVDRWTSKQSHDTFVEDRRGEFDALDARGDRQTEGERRIGEFEEISGVA